MMTSSRGSAAGAVGSRIRQSRARRGVLVGESRASSVCKQLDLGAIEGFFSLEHRQLKLWPVKLPVLLHPRAGNGLEHEVDVSRVASAVRPERKVDLLGLREVRNYGGDSGKERAERVRLILFELPQMDDVPLRLYDQCSDPKRPNAVLDDPQVGLDPAAREVDPSLRQVARETAFHADEPKPTDPPGRTALVQSQDAYVG
jgi:hypothetical protein